MTKYLTGEALDSHYAKLAEVNAKLDKEHPLNAEGDLETHCVIMDVPLWQGKTDCVKAFVLKGEPLDKMLAKYGLTEEEYKINLERLARGEGVDY